MARPPGELGRLLVDADAAVGGTDGGADALTPTAAPATAAAAATAGGDATALFDEDLDASVAASPASRSPAVRATARRAACLRALAALAAGPDPEAAGTHLSAAVDAVAGSEDGTVRGARPPPPTSLWIAAAGALVDAAVAGSATARGAALALAATPTGDLLSRGRAIEGGLAAAVATVASLADAWPRPAPTAAPPAVQAAKAAAAAALGAPLLACLEIAKVASPGGDLDCAAGPPHDRGPQPLPGRLRAGLAGAAAAVLAAGGAGGWGDGEAAHDQAVFATLRALRDVSYAARLAAAPAAARMLPMYARRGSVYGAILERLTLPGGAGEEGGGPTPFGHPQRVETALAALAAAATVDDGAETAGLHALLATAAQAAGVIAAAPAATAAAAAGPGTAKEVAKAVATAEGAGRAAQGVRRAAAAALRAAAAGLGYPSRSAHLAWRLPDCGHALAGVGGDAGGDQPAPPGASPPLAAPRPGGRRGRRGRRPPDPAAEGRAPHAGRPGGGLPAGGRPRPGRPLRPRLQGGRPGGPGACGGGRG